MSDSILESIRSKLEHYELYNSAIVNIIIKKSKINNVNKHIEDHKINNISKLIQDNCLTILNILRDDNKLFQNELLEIKSDNSLNSFNNKLKDIKSYNNKYIPNNIYTNDYVNNVIDNIFNPPFSYPYYTSDEYKLNAVDLNKNYNELLNFKEYKNKYKVNNYEWYLINFNNFSNVSVLFKIEHYNKYKTYLSNLNNYLIDFYQRSNILIDFNIIINNLNTEYNDMLLNDNIDGFKLEYFTDNSISYCEICNKYFFNGNTYKVL